MTIFIKIKHQKKVIFSPKRLSFWNLQESHYLHQYNNWTNFNSHCCFWKVCIIFSFLAGTIFKKLRIFNFQPNRLTGSKDNQVLVFLVPLKIIISTTIRSWTKTIYIKYHHLLYLHPFSSSKFENNISFIPLPNCGTSTNFGKFFSKPTTSSILLL